MQDWLFEFRAHVDMTTDWKSVFDEARLAYGRGDTQAAICLVSEAVAIARESDVSWHHLQSALCGAGLFHQHCTHNYHEALRCFRESHTILAENIGAESREARSLFQHVEDCQRELNEASD